ncbi:MAG: hypothetical protein E7511_05830 [Ruminococcus sp.]|nr:hypothetical protein [Ruminococcus sp.]
MDVRMNINLGAIEKKLQKAADKAVYITAEKALEDSNKYCPKDQDGLINSSLTFSEPEKGIIRWTEPYARALYYGVVMVDPETGKACFFIDDQPYSRKGVKKVKSDPEREYQFANGRRKLWAQYAHSKHGKEWLETFRAAMRQAAKEG